MKLKYCILLSLLFLQISCTEPFEIETIGFQKILVVESTITNEVKQQLVKLSRTTTLENLDVVMEKNAIVNITDSNGNVFNFSQDNITGHYLSDKEFQAKANITYTLGIRTEDGKQYTSSAVTLPPVVNDYQVYAELVSDKEGIQVFVDAHDTTGAANYFRYEYEEVYKVVAPYPSSYFSEIINDDVDAETYEVSFSPRVPEVICYSSVNSIGVLQTATTDLDENRISRFPVRFIDKSNAVLRERYSILVKQYVQSIEAYTFYNIIKELGSVESLLSQGQPGYVSGNMTSLGNLNEKVLGFFEISSVTSKRVYFNYTDFELEKPPYFIECELLRLDYRDNTVFDDDPNDREIIRTRIKYFGYELLRAGHPYYTIVQGECSVCTSFSSKVKPDFWKD